MPNRTQAGGIILKKRKRRYVPILVYGFYVVLAVILLVIAWQVGKRLEFSSKNPEARGDHTQRYEYDHMIELDGTAYRQKKGMTTILLMGIDTASENTEAQSYRNGGQADFLRLLVIDDTNKSVIQMQIDRDIMTPITVLGVLGNKSGVRTAQICLSHGFGDGQNQSCELTVDAVSNLLFGVPIDFYLAMNLDGISTLNDMMGGVTVMLEDDFSSLDPLMTTGTMITLTGDQAEIYVRSRKNIGVGSNEARMARQELYLSALSDLVYAKMGESSEFVGSLYDGLLPFLTTNLNRGRLINEAWATKDYERSAVVMIDGVYEVGSDGFMQFYADEEKLKETVIGIFYEEVK